ncbi:hypothetical protein A3Q56_04318 [Intoshia linei]|uniref:Uncharacterized protein n=1 Tax=Intoshia linei TaxID=1819745 RepID=A0A177B3E9_9BILA|nr:hypothetical protein A3Q56_04318 [Intoshia linei]
MELNAKKWGKEKSDLLIQLQEAENRFKSAIHVQETDKEFLRNLPYKRYDAKY